MKRQTTRNVVAGGLVLLMSAAQGWCQAKKLPLKELVALGKGATALVEIRFGDRAIGAGSAFCVHQSGLFVSNRHVLVHEGIEVDEITLILASGEKNERRVKVHLVGVSGKYDLALLKADKAPATFSPLALGTAEGLIETNVVLAFGFPFGKLLAVKPGSYPSISVNAGRITSLRKKKGVLAQIQLDNVLNLGNSGGPVIDTQGKVIGVVVSGLFGTGVNFAIPVNHLRQFLHGPVIGFTPPKITAANMHRPADFAVKITSPFKPTAKYSAVLTLTNEDGKRDFPLKRTGKAYKAQGVPVPPRKAAPALRLVADSGMMGKLEYLVADMPLTIGGQKVKLSEVRQITTQPKAEVLLRSGKRLRGKITGLEAVKATLSDIEATFDLSKSASIVVTRVVRKVAFVGYRLVVRDGTEVVEELSGMLVVDLRGASAALKPTELGPVGSGKAATALVEIHSGKAARGIGSAFCVNRSGLFVTNKHLLRREGGQVKEVTLVLAPGERNERRVKARLVRVSEQFDLALLQADEARATFVPLALGVADGLIETTEVLAFGFPFGKSAVVKRGSYPKISVSEGRIRSVRKEKWILTRFRIDVALSPGHSGGPLLDTQGKVIGVVVSGLAGKGGHFVIPVNHVKKFLQSKPKATSP